MKHKKCICGFAEYYSNGHYDQWLKILGIKVFKKTVKSEVPHLSFLGFRIRISASQRIEMALKDAGRTLKKSYSKICILFNNSGETSLLLASISEQLRGRDDILFIGTKGYHMQLLDHFLPNTTRLFIPELWSVHFQRNIPKKLQIGKSEVHIIAPFSYFQEYEKIIRESQNLLEIPHFYSRYCSYQILFKNLNASYPNIAECAIKLTSEKIKFLNIKKPFILICNETFSNTNLSDSFYQKLTKKCHALGYDVLFNSMALSSANMYGHTTVLSLAEAMSFAQKADCVIGIRSGVLDVLAPYSNNMIALYTAFRDRGSMPSVDASRIQVAFTLKKSPTISPSKIHEFIVEDQVINDENANDRLLNNIGKLLVTISLNKREG